MDSQRKFLFLRGLKDHLSHATVLRGLRRSTGQDLNASTDPAYFATSAVDWGRLPWTIVIFEGATPVGAVLLREVTKHTIPTGYFFASDATDEEFVLAPAEKRESTLRCCVEEMLRRKPSAIIFLTTKAESSVAEWGSLKYRGRRASMRYRLPIRRTVNETLSQVGAHTKKNLRYYQSSAHKAGMRFHFFLKPAERRDAVMGLHSMSDFRVSLRGLNAVLDAIDSIDGSFCMGLQTAAGMWVSVALGWRQGGKTHIFFLMNHTEYRKASLSTTMRSLMISHEVERGTEEMSVVGGTNAIAERSCVEDSCHQVLLARPSWRLSLMLSSRRFLTLERRLSEVLG